MIDWSQKRVLVLGSKPGNQFPLWRGIEQGIAKLQKRGAAVLYLALNDQDIPGRTGEALAFQPTHTLMAGTRPANLMRTPSLLKLLPGLKALWHCDLRPPHTEYAAFKGVLDYVFLVWHTRSGDFDTRKWFNVTGALPRYMPQASPRYNALPNRVPNDTCVFIGDIKDQRFHSERKGIAQALHANVINKTARNDRLKIELRSPTIYRSARYCLSMSPIEPLYTSLRTYNILGCGGLMLLRKFPLCERLFKHGEHALMFDTPGEAISLIQRYNNDPEARDTIADAGLLLQRAKHTGAHRLFNMIEDMDTGCGFKGFLR